MKQLTAGLGSFLLLVLLVWVTYPRPGNQQVYDCVLTRDRLIGPDEVLKYRVVSIKKQGWLTSDRYRLVLEDGSVVMLKGNWNAVLTPVIEEAP